MINLVFLLLISTVKSLFFYNYDSYISFTTVAERPIDYYPRAEGLSAKKEEDIVSKMFSVNSKESLSKIPNRFVSETMIRYYGGFPFRSYRESYYIYPNKIREDSLRLAIYGYYRHDNYLFKEGDTSWSKDLYPDPRGFGFVGRDMNMSYHVVKHDDKETIVIGSDDFSYEDKAYFYKVPWQVYSVLAKDKIPRVYIYKLDKDYRVVHAKLIFKYAQNALSRFNTQFLTEATTREFNYKY